MFAGSFSLFGITIAVMSGAIGLSILGGLIHAKIKHNRYMKIFNADCAKSRFEKLPS
jgi:hypothetical protein